MSHNFTETYNIYLPFGGIGSCFSFLLCYAVLKIAREQEGSVQKQLSEEITSHSP